MILSLIKRVVFGLNGKKNGALLTPRLQAEQLSEHTTKLQHMLESHSLTHNLDFVMPEMKVEAI